MDRLGVVYSQSNNVDGFDENVRAWGCLFSGGRDWPFQENENVLSRSFYAQVFGTFLQFWVNMYRLGVFCCHAVDFGHFWGENVVARGFLSSDGGFWPFWGENVLAGGCLFSAGRIWPFWAKMYRLGVFMPRQYILAILGENVPAGVFLFCTFWPFWAVWEFFTPSRWFFVHFCTPKTCWPGVF